MQNESCYIPLSQDFHTKRERERHQLLIAAITKPQLGYFRNQHGINRHQEGPQDCLPLFSKAFVP